MQQFSCCLFVLLTIFKITTSLSIAAPSDPEGEVIEIDYCDASECPGCPPWPVCDCAPVETLALSSVATGTLDSEIISEPVSTPLVERKRGNGRRERRQRWYKHRPQPTTPTPDSPVASPCMCPLILCAAPPPCEC